MTRAHLGLRPQARRIHNSTSYLAHMRNMAEGLNVDSGSSQTESNFKPRIIKRKLPKSKSVVPKIDLEELLKRKKFEDEEWKKEEKALMGNSDE